MASASLPGPVVVRRSLGSVLLLLVTQVVGCGETSDPYGAVKGQVTFRHEPVPNAVVVFEHRDLELAVLADGNEAGNYEARRSFEMPGLPPGEYRVAVTPPMFYPGLGPVGQTKPPERPDIPQRYRDVATSGLQLTVNASETNELNIDMQPE